ncbi:unnamed protein product [Camellia sinensis]
MGVVGRRRSWLWERERGLEVARTNGERWHRGRAWKANGNRGKLVKVVGTGDELGRPMAMVG